MRAAGAALAALLLAGCVTDQAAQKARDDAAVDQILANARAREREKMVARASSYQQDLTAHGQRICTITNYGAVKVVGVRRGAGPVRWTMHPLETTYPGTRMFLLINGKRVAGSESSGVAVDGLLDELAADPDIRFGWTGWPYEDAREAKTTLTGFADALEECRTFLGQIPAI